MSKMYLISIFVVICQLSFHACLIEPQGAQCSTFDYDVKMLYKLIKVEEAVKSFKITLDEMKDQQLQDKVEQKQSLEKVMYNFKAQFEGLTKSQSQDKQEHKQSLETALKRINNGEEWLNATRQKSEQILTALNRSVKNVTDHFKKLSKRPAIGFSVLSPNGKSTAGDLTFNTINTNVGGSYDQSTGLFTCKVPGYYYITAMLLKDLSHQSSCYCYMNRNDDILVTAYTYPGTASKSRNAAVNSVFVHLDKGDTFRLTGCTTPSSMHSYSSFSGFLVTPGPE